MIPPRLRSWLWDTREILRSVSCPPGGPCTTYIAHAGLANRIRSWFFAHAISVQHGRLLVHCWSNNRFCGAAQQDLFPGAPQAARCGLRRWRLLRSQPSSPMHPLMHSGAEGVPLLVLGNCWQEVSAEDWIAAGLPNRELVDDFRKMILGEEAREPRRLAVHIRLGDFTGSGRSPPLSAFTRAAESLLRGAPSQFDKIELFSDNVESCLPFFQAHFGRAFVTSEEESNAAGQRGSLDAAKRALRRLRQIATSGGAVLTARSSFGAMAVALGGIPLHRMAVVEPPDH